MMKPPLHPTSISPSFTTTTSSNNLADIAARVIQELRNETGLDDIEYDEDIYNFNEDDVYQDDETDDVGHDYIPVDKGPVENISKRSGLDTTYDVLDQEPLENISKRNGLDTTYDMLDQDYVTTNQESDTNRTENLKQTSYDTNESEEDLEFEFNVFPPYNTSTLSSNNIIQLRYPLFDQSLLLLDDNVVLSDNSTQSKQPMQPPTDTVRQPLRKLFMLERETVSCSSSSESISSDDLDGVSPATYCIWKPKVEETLEGCKKSKSTGNTSKRWTFKNLLNRSNSDVNISTASVNDFRQLTAKKSVKKVEKTAKVAGEPVTEPVAGPVKKELASVFANVNGLSRNLRPF